MKKLFSISIIFSSLFTSCSIKYNESFSDENILPEFIFEESNFSRYEENVKTINLNANRLEQYKIGNSMYAQDVEFNLFSKTGELETSGKCGLIGANSKEEKYVLFDQIEIDNKKDKINIQAENLKWDGKTEQLTSGLTDSVLIKKDGTEFRGSGFSASGVSKKFEFTGYVSGNIETENKQQSEKIDEN